MSTNDTGFIARDLHGADALGLMAERPVRSLFNPRTITTQAELSFLSQSAKDGDEVYVLADSANGVRWRFRYNASSTSAYRWEFVGGPHAVGSEIITSETTASATYTDLATVGPTITLSLAGQYDVTVAAQMTHTATNGVALMAYSCGTYSATDEDCIVTMTESLGQPAMTHMRTTRRTLPAGTLTAKYRASGANAGFSRRWMFAVPVRVG